MRKKNLHKSKREFCIPQAKVGDLIAIRNPKAHKDFGIVIKVINNWHELSYEVTDPLLYHCLVKGEKLGLIRESFEVIGD